MVEVIGAQLVIEALRHEGMDTVYVLPGDPVGSIVNNMVLAQLNEAWNDNPVKHGETDWIRSLREYALKNQTTVQPMLDSDAIPRGYYRMHREVRDYIAEDTIVVADGASTMDISRQVVYSYKPRHLRLWVDPLGTDLVGEGITADTQFRGDDPNRT